MTGAPGQVSARQARRTLLVITFTRWFPVGLTIGVTTLLPLERGMSLAQIGVILSMQGFVVLGLELPTGVSPTPWVDARCSWPPQWSPSSRRSSS